jgi:hypothetical protein
LDTQDGDAGESKADLLLRIQQLMEKNERLVFSALVFIILKCAHSHSPPNSFGNTPIGALMSQQRNLE